MTCLDVLIRKMGDSCQARAAVGPRGGGVWRMRAHTLLQEPRRRQPVRPHRGPGRKPLPACPDIPEATAGQARGTGPWDGPVDASAQGPWPPRRGQRVAPASHAPVATPPNRGPSIDSGSASLSGHPGGILAAQSKTSVNTFLGATETKSERGPFPGLRPPGLAPSARQRGPAPPPAPAQPQGARPARNAPE